jgi:hypothetical protein
MEMPPNVGEPYPEIVILDGTSPVWAKILTYIHADEFPQNA